MNTFMNNLENETNYTYTTNGALAHKTTNSALYDLFAFGGAMRNRSDEDCVLAFRNAFDENEEYAMKCLFYLRDIIGGQGERRFFRVVMKDLATYNSDAVRRNWKYISEFGRWDDLYTFVGTPLQAEMFYIIKKQLDADCDSIMAGPNEGISLLAKWLKSENTSSKESKRLAVITRKALGLTSKQYRKTLSILRERINVLERLMSAGKWDEIEFDKIPSKAGLKYKNAFARHDMERMCCDKVISYADFAKDENTTVNAAALYPYEIVRKASFCNKRNETDRLMIEKYWKNQVDVLNGNPCKMLCVCDTSGSMTCGMGGTRPIDVAIGLSMYCAERIGGPFKNHYISFSSKPQLIKIEGTDFVDKVERIYRTSLCDNTNIEATFKLIKKACLTAKPEDIPESIVIISDMQIDAMTGDYWSEKGRWTEENTATEMERIRKDWEKDGLKCPKLYYWNINAKNPVILDAGPNVSFVSGCSPILFKQVVTGKTGVDLMFEILKSERYKNIK